MIEKVRCLIVDDEPLSRQVIEKYVCDIPSLEVVASLPDAIKALEVIRNGKIDLVFLDINMPILSGISMVKSLEDPPLVIFTTAYPEHAVEGFEMDVVDYLVKPFSFERFLKAYHKALDRLDRISRNSVPADRSYLMLRADKKIHKIAYSEILYMESKGDYVRFICEKESITAHYTMKQLEEELPGEQFIRTHRSYLVNLEHIDFMEGNYISVKGTHIPVGSSYRMDLLDRMQPGN